MHKTVPQRRLEQARPFALLFTFCGGFLNAFTFVQCGQTLSGAQTGNIIFLGAALANHDVIGIIDRCSALGLYIAGIIVAIAFQTHIKYWRIFCLIPILIIGCFVGAMPESFPAYLSVGMISFGLALPNTAFNKIEGLSYSSAFTTGNLKKLVIAWTEYGYHKDPGDLIKAINYSFIVLSFLAGVLAAAFIQPHLKMKTIWVVVVILIITDLVYYWQKKDEPD